MWALQYAHKRCHSCCLMSEGGIKGWNGGQTPSMRFAIAPKHSLQKSCNMRVRMLVVSKTSSAIKFCAYQLNSRFQMYNFQYKYE